MKNTLVQDTVSAVLVQGKLGEEFRADFVKLVEKVWDTASSTVNPAPTTADEKLAALKSLLASL